MGFFKTDVELIEPKKQTNNKTDKITGGNTVYILLLVLA